MLTGAQALIIGASLSAAAAVAHLTCILIGAPAYRFLGAGERMARAVEARKLRPTLTTLAISCVLFSWSAYALSGAGIIGTLPLTKLALAGISAIYLARAIAFPLLKRAFPENTRAFWWVSSCICGVIGLCHAYGVSTLWREL